MHSFSIGRLYGRNALPSTTIESMYRLRYRVFHERLSWEVKVEEGQERDEFDDENTVYVAGINLLTGEVEAAWRLRPTTLPYMLRDTFPQLLQQRSAPRNRATWEVSRFAVVNTPYAESGAGSFGDLTRDLVAHTVQYAAKNGIDGYIWVTSVGVERMARRLGYSLERWGAPKMIGHVNCVVNKIAIDANSLRLADLQLGRLIQEAA